jgi:hypothetical protein
VGKPLAERSALLLLMLTHNLRAVDEGALLKNPFREALARLVDAPAAPASDKSPVPTAASLAQGVPVPFRALFTSLVALCEQPLGVCLLYTLLQSSRAWCECVLSRGDVDQLLLPLLSQLYSVPTLGSEHRYILLIALLLFTQYAAFCETAHRRVRVPARRRRGGPLLERRRRAQQPAPARERVRARGAARADATHQETH